MEYPAVVVYIFPRRPSLPDFKFRKKALKVYISTTISSPITRERVAQLVLGCFESALERAYNMGLVRFTGQVVAAVFVKTGRRRKKRVVLKRMFKNYSEVAQCVLEFYKTVDGYVYATIEQLVMYPKRSVFD